MKYSNNFLCIFTYYSSNCENWQGRKVTLEEWKLSAYDTVGSQEFLIPKIKNLETTFTDFGRAPLKLKGKVNLKQYINWH